MNTQAEGSAGDVLDRPRSAASLADAMEELLRDVRATALPLDIPGVGAARESRTRLIDQLADHLVPRLRTLTAPAVVVVAGSTGAGKSTLVNALVGAQVSPAGVLRPTTRRPVLVHHPLDTDLLAGHPVTGAVQVEVSDQVPRGVALLDAPDLDSVEEANRRAAGRLLEAADLWLFVTTAARYGDALPWRVLDGAVARGASVAMVLNRVPADSLPTVRADLMQRLREHQMAGSPLFVVADAGPLDGPLEPAAVAPVRRWLTMVAGPDRARSVIARTLRGSLAALRPWVDELAEAVQAQAEAASELRTGLATAGQEAGDEARATLLGGAAGHGGPQARWAELTSPGAALHDLLRSGDRPDRSRARGRDRAIAVQPLVRELTTSVCGVLTAIGQGAERDLRGWLRSGPSGGSWLAQTWDGQRRAEQRAIEARSAAERWIESGRNLHVRAEPAASGADRRTRRRAAQESRRVAAAYRALGSDGVHAVLVAGAAGVEDAERIVGALLGEAGRRGVAQLRDGLGRCGADAVDAERAAALAALDVPDLAEDASATLRMRLAVIKGLT
ncbi:dynamin family protein [Cellulomonas sp. NPDC089187]|uniref:dynamin family protein n=1 Tax=Cellulomonas sp. NPDC089187 TaxID=3154970 RepID=UPI003426471C